VAWRRNSLGPDFDEALMHRRRGNLNGPFRAKPLLDAAVELFRTLGMTGGTRRAEQLALDNWVIIAAKKN
jgi:hypothetical protein